MDSSESYCISSVLRYSAPSSTIALICYSLELTNLLLSPSSYSTVALCRIKLISLYIYINVNPLLLNVELELEHLLIDLVEVMLLGLSNCLHCLLDLLQLSRYILEICSLQVIVEGDHLQVPQVLIYLLLRMLHKGPYTL